MLASIHVKSILNRTKHRDPWFLDDYTVNPYSGCSFNCLFCYIRGSKYGINMAERVSVKENAVELLDRALAARAKKGQYGIIVLSSATDPYLHFEEELQLTRRMLEVIRIHRFPVHIITRSPLVTRDFDLLKAINETAQLPADLEGKLKEKVLITFSFSTIDDVVASIFEPGAPSPSARLRALQHAVNARFLSGVSLMPLLPYITDTGAHLDEMFLAFKSSGAKYIFPATLTLFGTGPADSKTLIFRAVRKHYPHLVEKYEKLFAAGTGMPAYYTQAFYNKSAELCERFGIPDRIVRL